LRDQSHIDDMRAAIRGDLERARARRPSIFARPSPPPPPAKEPPQPETVAEAEPEPSPESPAERTLFGRFAAFWRS